MGYGLSEKPQCIFQIIRMDTGALQTHRHTTHLTGKRPWCTGGNWTGSFHGTPHKPPHPPPPPRHGWGAAKMCTSCEPHDMPITPMSAHFSLTECQMACENEPRCHSINFNLIGNNACTIFASCSKPWHVTPPNRYVQTAQDTRARHCLPARPPTRPRARTHACTRAYHW